MRSTTVLSQQPRLWGGRGCIGGGGMERLILLTTLQFDSEALDTSELYFDVNR